MNYKVALGILMTVLVASIIADLIYGLPLAYELFVVLFIFPLTLMMMGYAYMSPRREEEEFPFIGY